MAQNRFFPQKQRNPLRIKICAPIFLTTPISKEQSESSVNLFLVHATDTDFWKISYKKFEGVRKAEKLFT